MKPSLDPPEIRTLSAEALPAIVALVGLAALAYAASFLPKDPSELAHLALDEAAGTDFGNPVTVVLLDFRAFDTLLETAVLVLALTGLWALTPGRDWAGSAANFRTQRPVEPQLVVLLKVLVPLVLLTAFYLLWLGADEPGGAFQSGTLLAAVGVLLVSSKVLPAPAHGSLLIRVLLVFGFLVFALAGLLSALLGEGFLDYPAGWEKAIIVAIETALTISIAAVLFMLANGLPAHPPRQT